MKLKPTKSTKGSNHFMQACALARMKVITGQECQALTGATQSDILAAINTDECKTLATQLQINGIGTEVMAQLDLFRTQMKLRSRMDDPEIATNTLITIGTFLYNLSGMKERRQAKVQETAPKMGVFVIHDHHTAEDIARMKEGYTGGLTINLSGKKLPTVIDADEGENE